MSEGLEVTFLDQTGAKTVRAKVSPTVTVKNILPSIITKMLLPATAPDGTPMSYSLDHKEGGRRLLETQTLPEAGVKEGDHLIVYPEITAGDGIHEVWAFVGSAPDGSGEESLLGAEIPGVGWMPFAASTQEGLEPFTQIVKDAMEETEVQAKIVRFVTREDAGLVS